MISRQIVLQDLRKRVNAIAKGRHDFGVAGGQIESDAKDFRKIAKLFKERKLQLAWNAYKNIDTAAKDAMPKSFIKYYEQKFYLLN